MLKKLILVCKQRKVSIFESQEDEWIKSMNQEDKCFKIKFFYVYRMLIFSEKRIVQWFLILSRE